MDCDDERLDDSSENICSNVEAGKVEERRLLALRAIAFGRGGNVRSLMTKLPRTLKPTNTRNLWDTFMQ